MGGFGEGDSTLVVCLEIGSICQGPDDLPRIPQGAGYIHHCLVADKVGRFRYPFAELGIPPEMGSSFLFPRSFAKRFVMTGDWFDGTVAEKYGLVYKVVPVEMSNIL